MIQDKQEEIINKIDNSNEIKRFKELEKKIKSNKEYIRLTEEFENNRELYEKEDRLNEEIINYRKKIFLIDEVKEYAKIESDIRLLSKSISKTISSLVEKKNCK